MTLERSAVTAQVLRQLREEFEAELQAVKGPRHIKKHEIVEELLPQIQQLRGEGYCSEAITRLLDESGFSIRPQTLERCLRKRKPKRRARTSAGTAKRATKPATPRKAAAPAAPATSAAPPLQPPPPLTEPPSLSVRSNLAPPSLAPARQPQSPPASPPPYRPARSTWVSPRKTSPDDAKSKPRFSSSFEIPDEVPLDQL